MTGRKAYSIVVHGAGCAFQATIAKARLPGQNQFVVFSGRSKTGILLSRTCMTCEESVKFIMSAVVHKVEFVMPVNGFITLVGRLLNKAVHHQLPGIFVDFNLAVNASRKS
jgi:hypothetical protein